jgi:LysM repeat protein
MRKMNRRKRRGATSRGLVGALFKGTQRLPAHVSEESEWYLDGAEVKLTRVFTIVLILHLIAVGGILAFKMIEKASVPSAALDTGNQAPEQQEQAKDQAAVVSAKTGEVKQPLKIERRNPVIVGDPSRKGMSMYRVTSGETLVSVARDQGVGVAELRRLNDLHTGDELYSGTWLSIPEKKEAGVGSGAIPEKEADSASSPKVLKAKPIEIKPAPKAVKVVVDDSAPQNHKAKPVAEAKSANPPAKKMATYTVQSGDTLYGIARKTGTSYSSLLSLNKLEKPELLQVGQVLKIEGK